MIEPTYPTLEALITALENTHQETLTYFDLEPEKLDRSYAPGKWTVRQLLHHITDADSVLYDRIRRVISTDRPVIWSFDQDAWANQLNYDTQPLSINKVLYSAVRSAVVDLAKRFYNQQHYARPFIHSETGLRTLKEEFEKVAWHNQHHLQQIRKALSQ